jgi:glutamyl-tRNA synthetase/glutamyl-Q tRNA(Asp) synthetase
VPSPLPHTRSPIAPIRASLTRFAPAPTGWLHLGHVLNACYVWNTAAAIGCHVLLRIEDHDRERCRPEFETGILDDLDWLGLAPDLYPTDCFRTGRCEGRQSDREQVYREALDLLIRDNLVYACDCSRRTLAAHAVRAAPAGHGGRTGDTDEEQNGSERRYPGTCRDRRLPVRDGYGWRVRLDDSVEEFDDALLGRQVQKPADQCGDLLIRDRLGNWTYQFAATVDDYWQDIDLVIRGVDLLESTGRQIQLARLLGRPAPPTYMHHPLIMKSADQKLSKSDRDTGIRSLRADGWSRERIFAEVERHHR